MPRLEVGQVQAVLAHGATTRVDEDVAPKFAPGARVRVRNEHPRGHTRAPRYVRGRAGVVDRDHGVFVFPDTNARDGTRSPQHVYSVRFSAREIWGVDASGSEHLYVDLWDAYLEPA